MTAVDSHASVTGRTPGGATLRDVVAAYVGLTKPRVIELLLLTTVPVMFFAAGDVPPLGLVVATVLGGTLSAGSANAVRYHQSCWCSDSGMAMLFRPWLGSG